MALRRHEEQQAPLNAPAPAGAGTDRAVGDKPDRRTVMAAPQGCRLHPARPALHVRDPPQRPGHRPASGREVPQPNDAGRMSVYNRHDYAAERIAAAELWEIEVERILK